MTNEGPKVADTSGALTNIPAFYSWIKDFRYTNGVRLAINFTVDFDTMLNRRLRNEPIMELTKGEFGGRVGIWRLLDLFGKHNIKLTIFTPGRICELYPEALKEAARQGHELANHTWEHRVPSELELEKDHLVKATDAIHKICDKKPIGSRSGHKISLLKEHGYIYQSFNCADDVPYYIFDEMNKYILNLPLNLVLDDAMYFNFAWFGSGAAGQRIEAPDKVFRIWMSAFQRLYKSGSYMNVVMHPFVSGRSLRIEMLDKLLFEIKSYPGVWFCTCQDLATYCIKNFPPREQVCPCQS
jgi:peptidoglycan-N-acetylglucosamine deacetylase